MSLMGVFDHLDHELEKFLLKLKAHYLGNFAPMENYLLYSMCVSTTKAINN